MRAISDRKLRDHFLGWQCRLRQISARDYAGQPMWSFFRVPGKTWVPELRSKAEKIEFSAGDSFRAASPGGGGYGDPRERDLDAVERDLNRGCISREAAESKYGVIIAEAVPLAAGHTRYRLDAKASAERRQRSSR